MKVAQVSFHVDAHRRPPDALLEAWPSLTAVASATVRSGCRLTIVQAAHETAKLQRDGVSYHFQRIPPGLGGGTPRGAQWLRGGKQLLSVIADAQPDVVHVEGLSAPIQTRLLTRRFPKVPVLAQDHADRPANGPHRWLDRWGFRNLSGVAFTSRDQAAPFVKSGILRQDIPVFEVIEGSTSFTPGDQAKARAKCGLFGDPCLLWVGRLDENKDPLTVLDAVDRVIPELPDVRLWCLYSSAPLLDAVRKRLDASPRLSERVRLLGEVPHYEMEDFYRAADLFVLASHREGSGFALLEALACGTTPLVTEIPSFGKITGGGEVGELFRLGDVPGLAERIVSWSQRVRPRLREQVRCHFESRLSYDAIARQLLDAYKTLLRST